MSRPNPVTHGADDAEPQHAPTAMVLRIVAAERDYVDGQIGVLEERFRGIDRANQLLSETVNRVPTDVTREVAHLQSVMDERFSSIETQFRERDTLSVTQFKERDTRAEREARDNKLAVDAAFAAQEKQAVAQNEGNNLAIAKSETATSETIKTNQELSKSEINALRKSVEDTKQRQTEVDDDLKKRLGAIEASLVGLAAAKQNATETRIDRHAVSGQLIAVSSVVVVLLGVIVPIIVTLLIGPR